MASSAVRAHAQTGRGRGRGRGIPPRNTPSPPPPAPPAPAPSRRRNAPSVPRPIPQGTIDYGYRYSIAQRVQCLTLIVEGFSGADIKAKTGFKRSAQSYIKKRAYLRGFRPEQDPRILEHYV